jgi:hypothetical protein
MLGQSIEQLGAQSIVAIFAVFAVVLAMMVFLLWLNWKREGIRGDLCPYSHRPMRLGIDVARSMAEFVNAFLEEQPKPDNPPIDFARASHCPVTGRIFPLTVSTAERISLSWDFLQKRLPGTYVSWGALSEEEKGEIKLLHGSLEGFQTEQSSAKLRPEDVEIEYAMLFPGPLYVDRKTKILMGWKKVPGTYFEVLIVQRPQFQSIDETL